MYKHCWNLLYGIFYIGVIDFALSQQKGLDKSVNLALETVFEFDKDGKLDIQLLNNVQKFIGKVKNVLEKKHIERRQTGTDQINIFTNFILNIVNILSQFEDNDLERFFAIINNEIQRYCDENDDAHILNKFSLIRNMPAYVLRRYLKIIANKIEEEAYFEEEKAVIDGVNYIMKQDDTTKIDKFINNLEEYRRKSRRNIDLVQLIKSALQNIFLDGYYRFKPPVKSLLRTILHYYFGNFIPIPTKYPVSKQPNSVNRAKLKTTKESRTWRQMYAEKNLDLKYPYDYTSVTKEQKSRTQKSRLMTVPKTRATKESHYSKGMKYGKVMEYDINYDTSKQRDNLDDEKPTTNMTKMFDEYYYRRFLDKKYNKKLNQFKTSKRGQKKNKAKHKSLNKLSTFYLDLENLSAISYVQQRFETSTHEYERPAVVRPFTTGIKHGKHWNSRHNLQKSKHYGYIQKKRQDVFVNEQQMSTKNNYLEMSRMPPISLNMQLNIKEEPSTLDNDTTLGNRDVKNLLSSEEGLSIEGFQEIKRKIYNRRSSSNNDTANNNVFNLIQKIEQDLEVVKTKIHNVSVFKNNNGLDEIIKVTENDVNKLKAGIDLNKRVNQEVINIPKFYLERDRNDVEIKKKKYSSPDEKATFKSTGVNVAEPIYMAARKTIYDQKWYPVVKSGAANSDEIVIQRKYEPLEDALPQQNEHDCQENLNVMNNNVPISKNSPTKYEVPYESLINENNSITTDNILKEKAKNEELENTTIKKVSANTNNLKDKEKMKVIYKANDDKTLPNYNTNVKLTQDEITNYQNTKENATKQNILIELNKIKDMPTLKSQINEMNNIQNVKLKEITTTRSDNKTTLVTNYKNTTDSAVTVNNLITTQKVTDVIFDNNKF